MGCEGDLDQAFQIARRLVVNRCIDGFHLYKNEYEDSQWLLAEQEHAVCIEIEKYYRKAKEILIKNQDFFEKIAVALVQTRLLSAADIQKIEQTSVIVPVIFIGKPESASVLILFFL